MRGAPTHANADGYTSFLFDLSASGVLLPSQPNVLAIRVESRGPAPIRAGIRRATPTTVMAHPYVFKHSRAICSRNEPAGKRAWSSDVWTEDAKGVIGRLDATYAWTLATEPTAPLLASVLEVEPRLSELSAVYRRPVRALIFTRRDAPTASTGSIICHGLPRHNRELCHL